MHIWTGHGGPGGVRAWLVGGEAGVGQEEGSALREQSGCKGVVGGRAQSG